MTTSEDVERARQNYARVHQRRLWRSTKSRPLSSAALTFSLVDGMIAADYLGWRRYGRTRLEAEGNLRRAMLEETGR